MAPRVLACLLVSCCGTAAVSADWLGLWSDRTLTTAHEVRNLSGHRAASGLPVRLTGVVTHVDPHTREFWVQDETAGVYVKPHPDAAALQQGDQVEVEGRTDAGEFAPCVLPHRLRPLGKGSLPDPHPFNFSARESRWLDAQWVQSWVVVRGVHTGGGATRIEVFTSQGCGTLVVPGEEWADAAGALRGAALVVRGVCVPTVKDRKVAGTPQVYLSALPERPPPTPPLPIADVPPRVIDHLLQFTPAPHPGLRRVKIAGVVTANPLPGMVVVQDQTGGAAVWLDDPAVRVPTGVWVEASGLLEVEGPRVSLTRAAVEVVRPAALPEPVAAEARELTAGTREGVLVKMAGRLEGLHPVGKWTAITLADGAFRFDAYVPGDAQQDRLSGLANGSRVEVTGVPLAAAPDGTTGPVPGVFLRGADAVSVLEPPQEGNGHASWWTPARIASVFGGFLAVALAVALVGGTWVWALRVRVRRAAAQIERHYDEKAKLEQQLRQAAKLEAVGRLAGGIAHDFNNLLTVINGCAELLAEDSSGDPRRLADLTDDIRRAGDRAAALTGQLLTFSRKREIQISPVDLNEVVADTARLLRRVIGEDIKVEVGLSQELPLVRAEPGLLHQVLMNLAVNARDAMPRGGILTLATALAYDSDGSAPRKYVRLTVTDTGVGMSEEVKARVFEPFFTTKEVNKGTGLGLATVYGVVQSLAGKIRVESKVGSGTTFQIDLRVHGEPLSDAELSLPSTPLPPARAPAAARLVGTAVLVVEDNEMVRNLLVTGLTAEGARVIAAEGPVEALRVLDEHREGIDVMVTDVVMPRMSGRELADRVRHDRPDVRVLFMSGYTADEVIRQGVLEDQVEFIQKPFTTDHLTSRLLRVLGRVST